MYYWYVISWKHFWILSYLAAFFVHCHSFTITLCRFCVKLVGLVCFRICSSKKTLQLRCHLKTDFNSLLFSPDVQGTVVGEGSEAHITFPVSLTSSNVYPMTSAFTAQHRPCLVSTLKMYWVICSWSAFSYFWTAPQCVSTACSGSVGLNMLLCANCCSDMVTVSDRFGAACSDHMWLWVVVVPF